MQDYFDCNDESFLADIDALAEYLEEDNNKNKIMNPAKVAQFADAFKIISEITKNSKIKVSYKINEPYIGVGTISLMSRNISGINEEAFYNAAASASNIDIFPKDDGVVQCNLTFHGLANIIE